MVFFKSKPQNNVDISMCNPIIVNQTQQSIVLFLDRGVLYNKQVLAPGEAVGMTRRETVGSVVPYRVHAVVGDVKSLPTETQSMKNLLSTAIIPTAFIVGTLAAAYSAGTMTGPATAMSRAASGLVVRGMVIDSAALAAGSLSASRAAFIADKLIEKHPENFSAKSGMFMPGQRFVVVRGGIEKPLTMECITEKKFRKIAIQGDLKVPMDTLQNKIEYYTPSLFRFSSRRSSVKALEAGEEDTVALESGATAAAIENGAPTAGKTQETEEERHTREAMAQSVHFEEEQKRQQEYYTKIFEEKSKPVVLF